MRAIHTNLAATGFAEGQQAQVIRSDAVAALRTLAEQHCTFDLVLADPPYRWTDWGPLARRLLDLELLEPERLLVFQHHRRTRVEDLPADLRIVRSKRLGETVLTFIE